jgi:hypothetical protein
MASRAAVFDVRLQDRQDLRHLDSDSLSENPFLRSFNWGFKALRVTRSTGLRRISAKRFCSGTN